MFTIASRVGYTPYSVVSLAYVDSGEEFAVKVIPCSLNTSDKGGCRDDQDRSRSTKTWWLRRSATSHS